MYNIKRQYLPFVTHEACLKNLCSQKDGNTSACQDTFDSASSFANNEIKYWKRNTWNNLPNCVKNIYKTSRICETIEPEIILDPQQKKYYETVVWFCFQIILLLNRTQPYTIDDTKCFSVLASERFIRSFPAMIWKRHISLKDCKSGCNGLLKLWEAFIFEEQIHVAPKFI